MADFYSKKEATINASPSAVYNIVSDVSRHNELAGSGEVLTVRKLTGGDVGLGTVIEADEKVWMEGGQSMELQAKSVVVTHDPPNSISWVSIPILPDTVRRIQWWFNLTPQGEGTHVAHEVEVDWGNLKDPQLQGLRDNYEQIRAGIVRDGMEKTLQNLKRMVE